MPHEPRYDAMHQTGGPLPPPPPPLTLAVHAAVINRLTWNVWLWLVWLLPAVLITIKMFAPGGMEKLFLMLLSPVIILLAGVLGWLPRLILKKRGFRYSPSGVSAVFAVHWWAFSLCVLGIDGADHIGPIPSPLSLALPFLGDGSSSGIVWVSMWMTGLSYAALVALTIFTPAQTQQRRASWTALVAVVATPVVLIGLGAIV